MKTLFIMCIAIAFSYLFVGIATSADESLVVYLTFDEGQGKAVADATDYRNNGTIKGDPKWVPGKFGTALDFDGAGDSVEIPDSPSVSITTAVTMEMWVKLGNGAELKQAGMEKGGWETGEYSIYPVYEGGTVIQFFNLPAACGDAGIRGKTISDEKWHHFAGTWDGNTISLYVDGIVDKSGACAGKLLANTQALYIGSRNGGERFLTGIVDEVRVYDRALTEAEVKIDMETLGGLSVSPSEKMAVCWGKVKQTY